MALIQWVWSPYKNGSLEAVLSGGHCMKIRVLLSQPWDAKGCHQRHRSQERGWDRSSLESSEGWSPATLWLWTCGLESCGMVHFWYFKTFGPWSFITTALASYCLPYGTSSMQHRRGRPWETYWRAWASDCGCWRGRETWKLRCWLMDSISGRTVKTANFPKKSVLDRNIHRVPPYSEETPKALAILYHPQRVLVKNSACAIEF